MPLYDTPLHTNDQSLDRVLRAGLPVTLLLWDSRRGLAGALDDALKQTAKARAGSLLVARLDLADNPQAAARWGRNGVPALLLFRDGAALDEPIRAVTADSFRAWADYLLERGSRPAQSGTGRPTGPDLSRPDKSGPVTVTDATFQREVLESAVPVVVDFWAPWCGPCLMISPALERIAAEMGGRVKIAKVNVDENPRWAGQYGVQGIPTLLLVKEGRVVDRIVGALPEPYLRQRISVFA